MDTAHGGYVQRVAEERESQRDDHTAMAEAQRRSFEGQSDPDVDESEAAFRELETRNRQGDVGTSATGSAEKSGR